MKDEEGNNDNQEDEKDVSGVTNEPLQWPEGTKHFLISESKQTNHRHRNQDVTTLAKRLRTMRMQSTPTSRTVGKKLSSPHVVIMVHISPKKYS